MVFVTFSSCRSIGVTSSVSRSDFFVVLSLSFPPPPVSPPLAPPVAALSSWLWISYCDWTERAASAWKPVEISSQEQQERGETEVFCVLNIFFLGVFLHPVFFFFFIFWWTGHHSVRTDCLCWRRKEEGTWWSIPAFRNARSGLRMVSSATPSFTCFIALPLSSLHLFPLTCCFTPTSRCGWSDACKSILPPWNDAFLQKQCRLNEQWINQCHKVFCFCPFLRCFLCRAAVFHVSAWVSISECVSKHKLWVANGACSCCCVPHFQSTATLCGVLVQSGAAAAASCCCVPESSCAGMWFPCLVSVPQAACRSAVNPRGRQAGVWREQNVSITPSARKPSHQQLLLLFSGDWFLMSQFSHHLASPPADQSGELPLRIYVAATRRSRFQGGSVVSLIVPKVIWAEWLRSIVMHILPLLTLSFLIIISILYILAMKLL